MATNKSITELTGVTSFTDSAFFTLVTAAGDNAKPKRDTDVKPPIVSSVVF